MGRYAQIFQLAGATFVSFPLLFSAAAHAQQPNDMDDLQCGSGGGMNVYVREILQDSNPAALDEEDQAMLNGSGSGVDYNEDIVPLIYEMQRHAADAAVEVIENDSTGAAYPIVRDEMLCAIAGQAESRFREDVNLRMEFRNTLAVAMLNHSADIVADFELLLDSLSYEEGRMQYGLMGEPYEIDHMSELMYVLSNAVLTPPLAAAGWPDVPQETKRALGDYMLGRIEARDQAFYAEGVFTLLGKIVASEPELVPRVRDLALSDHPQNIRAAEALRNIAVHNEDMPEEYARMIYYAFETILDSSESGYHARDVAAYGLGFLARRGDETGVLARQTTIEIDSRYSWLVPEL